MTTIHRSMPALALAIALAAGLLTAPAQAADTGQFTPMAEHYEAIWKALSGDTLDGVADHARAIAELAETGDHPAEAEEAVPAIVEHAGELAREAGAGDLDAAREAFGELTKPLVRYRKAVGAERLEVAYCPMAKKAWLQPDGDLANPYYGSEMLRCGDFVGS
jgi:hypothetical protein